MRSRRVILRAELLPTASTVSLDGGAAELSTDLSTIQDTYDHDSTSSAISSLNCPQTTSGHQTMNTPAMPTMPAMRVSLTGDITVLWRRRTRQTRMHNLGNRSQSGYTAEVDASSEDEPVVPTLHTNFCVAFEVGRDASNWWFVSGVIASPRAVKVASNIKSCEV